MPVIHTELEIIFLKLQNLITELKYTLKFVNKVNLFENNLIFIKVNLIIMYTEF